MDWQLDGRISLEKDKSQDDKEQSAEARVLTRRLQLFNPQNAFPELYIVLFSKDSENRPSPTFLGRKIGRYHADVARMRQWIDTCENHHGTLCQSLDDSSLFDPISGSQGILRFLDLDQNRLVTATPEMKYATLSYIWGGDISYKLQRDSVHSLSSKGASERFLDHFPRTIQHAILLLKRLGYRYLWVDSLCIIQDDSKDKAILIGIMDRIYSNSSVTTCAAGGDSKFGIPGALQTSRDLNQIVERCGNLELLAVRRVKSYIRRSPWNTRAWTFQEWPLSHRCLIFVDDRVFFQCRQATWSEELDGECTSLTWSLDMIGSPLTVFKENPLRRFSTYVKLYSVRKLTFYTDKLAAFEGLGKVLSSHLDAALHYGLPDSYFDWALLWELNMLPENIGTANSATLPVSLVVMVWVERWCRMEVFNYFWNAHQSPRVADGPYLDHLV
jgi:hypothetical protein